MKKPNTKKMLLTTVVAVVTVVFGFAAIGTSVVGPGIVPPPPPPPPEPEDLSAYVDIKPGSCPNPLNVKSGGVLPVAVLGTGEFDVAGIDVSTIRLTREGAGEVAPIRWCYEDVATPYNGTDACGCHELTGDGYTDLTLKFDRQELIETLGLSVEAGNTIPLTVTGTLGDGTVIEGSDCIWVLEKGKK